MSDKEWENVGEDEARYRLSVLAERIEVIRKKNGEKSQKTIALNELKRIRYFSKDLDLHFSGAGKWSLIPTTYNCASEEEREEILSYLATRLPKTPVKESKQNGFVNNAITAGLIIGVAALIFNTVLVGAFLGTSPPTPGVGGSKGSRILSGIQGLAHGMGWTGIVIMNIVFVGLWLCVSIAESRKEYVIHSLSWN